jgi:hypothetical protein
MSSSSSADAAPDATRSDAHRGDANRGDASRSDANRGDANRSDANRGDAHRPDAKMGEDAGTGKHDGALDASHDALRKDAATGSDATTEAAIDGSAGGPEHLLVTFGNGGMSELVAVNVATQAVDGRLQFNGVGATSALSSSSAFLMEQDYDIVGRLDSTEPWTLDSTWNVRVPATMDGGSIYAEPYSVVVQGPSKSYVLLYERNQIAVIDQAAGADGGTPVSTVDLSSFVQAGDSDGLVEMTAAAYVPSMARLYVVLANINQAEEAQYGGVICNGEYATVVAIDTTNDSVVNLGGSGPGGSIALTFAGPITAVYDPLEERLLVVGSGCYDKPAAGGTVAPASGIQRGVEQVALTSGQVTPLLSLDAIQFPPGFVDMPTGFEYIDSSHAIIGFYSTGQAVYNWNPTTTALGANIPNAPDVFTYDGHGHLLGTRLDTTDAGVQSLDVVSVSVSTGTWTSLGTNVTSLTGTTYVASVDVWPHP